jgi:ribosomal protein L11 methyltransferase
LADRGQTTGGGAWLELSVAADIEAVEAVSEILGRVAPVGTSVEPAFELIDEGLGARVDATRPAIVRAYLPAADEDAARRAIAEASEALGHLQAYGLRPIGELTTRVVHEADWAEAWKEHFPVLRVGRRIVIRPTWREHEPLPGDVVVALDPGMAFGTGLHPTTQLCLAALERLADQGHVAGRRVLDVGCGSGILALAAVLLGAESAVGVDTDRSPSRRRSRTPPATTSAVASPPAKARCRAGRGRSVSSSPTSLPASSSRSRRCSGRSWPTAESSSRPASSSTASPRSSRRSRRRVCG